MVSEIDTEADDNGVAHAFKQDARQLGPIDQQVVRPFEAEPRFADIGRDELIERDRRDQRQRRGRRIAGARPDERARIEIARPAFPAPPMPAAPARLGFGAEPDAFGRTGAGERSNVVIRGSRRRDRPYGARDQNRAFAAAMLAIASAGTAR
jgi:hypothetical protein